MTQKNIPGTNFNVQNIFCIGRNYSEHDKELNNPVPTSPVDFIKPTSSICYDNENLVIPKQSKRVDHEVEIVIVIGKDGKNIPESEASDYISHIGVGLDFTARDLQDIAKEKSLPWSIAKGFDTFAAISHFRNFDGNTEKLKNINFSLEVNGEMRQLGNSKSMLFPITYIISYLSTIYTLSEGDLIFTGTPAGISALNAGDKITAKIEDWATLSLGVVNA